jgi:putative ABC transport system ATP-binding protein
VEINVNKLTKDYCNGEVRIRALNEVSFDVKHGEILSIFGPSGCGKSTLLNCLSGIDTPNSGKVIIDGVDLHSLSDNEKTRFRAKNLGFIFQFYNLIPVLNAVENVELVLQILRVSEKEAREKSIEILKIVGLGEKINSYPSQLSGGERQRVSIARALVHNPGIIFADEPTGALDTETGIEILNLIKKLNSTYNQSFIIVTHDKKITEYSNRIIKMDSGKIDSLEENGEEK